MTLAIIPARGGSKSIPLKNIVSIAGRPLLAWSIEHALRADSVDAVVVSTDCQAIATVAEDEGAEVFWRSEETATDTASSESALLEVLRWYSEKRDSRLGEITVFLQATSPLRRDEDIDRAVEKLRFAGADSLFSARRVEGYLWQSTASVELLPLHRLRQPRQFRDSEMWEENGSIYVFRNDPFLQYGTRLCGRTVVYEMDALDSLQIDEPADIDRIEQLIFNRCRRDSQANAY